MDWMARPYEGVTQATLVAQLLYASPSFWRRFIQESPAIADKPARRERLPKIAPIRRAYNVVADDTGLSSFV